MKFIIVIINKNNGQRRRNQNKVDTDITLVTVRLHVWRNLLFNEAGEKYPDSEQRGIEIEGSKSGGPGHKKMDCLIFTTGDSIRYPPKGTKGSH